MFHKVALLNVDLFVTKLQNKGELGDCHIFKVVLDFHILNNTLVVNFSDTCFRLFLIFPSLIN